MGPVRVRYQMKTATTAATMRTAAMSVLPVVVVVAAQHPRVPGEDAAEGEDDDGDGDGAADAGAGQGEPVSGRGGRRRLARLG
jgi:hypothetical protein